MIEDKVWACAHQIMKQYGDAAGFRAAQRAEELLADGDMDEHRTWLRILARIRDLNRMEPGSGIQ